jgi:hypothetical protein
LVGGSKAGGEVYGRSGLANATFLISNRDNTSQADPQTRENLTKVELGSKMFHVEHFLWLWKFLSSSPGVFHVEHQKVQLQYQGKKKGPIPPVKTFHVEQFSRAYDAKAVRTHLSE